MSDAHDEGTGLGPVIWVIVFCIVGALVLVGLFFPGDTTTLFLGINDRINEFFEGPFFTAAKFISGMLIVGLGAFATWLFFRLLEIEKEHEEHVYHHASGHHLHTEHASAHYEPAPQEKPLHTEVHSVPMNQAQVKTAPPPARLPGESGIRGSQVGEEHPGHFQWQSVLRLATSNNPSDWKLAIIEADVILDMMTYMQGFPGATLGERLQNADPGSFKSLKYAKQAHYMRNQIAHEGNIELTPRDVNQTIRMYEAAFDEFKYI
jgi:hypothetical protein